AEDGIRDDLVTGVQTCALPIFEVKRFKDLSPRDIEHDNPEFRRHDEIQHFLEQIYGRPVASDDVVTVVRFSQVVESPPGYTERRSEERRVGKECRWGGRRDWAE